MCGPDPEMVSLTMDFMPVRWPFGFVPLGRGRGIFLRSTDIDRCRGGGVEIRGPAKPLMLAVSGRPALLHLLDGPWLSLLQSRMMAP